MTDSLDLACAVFAQRFAIWNIVLPADAVRRRQPGHIAQDGWLIQFLFGQDARGEYVDYYASHRMTDDEHARLRADGTRESLEGIVTSYGYRPEVPGARERAEAAYLAHNRRVAAELEAKGFGRFTLNQALRLGANPSDPTTSGSAA